jgi:hypothetical protein
MQLQGLYFRKADRWTDYELGALRDLDLLVQVDVARLLEAIAAVSKGAPRSLRTYSGGVLQVVYGGDLAARETMLWIVERARRAAKEAA